MILGRPLGSKQWESPAILLLSRWTMSPAFCCHLERSSHRRGTSGWVGKGGRKPGGWQEPQQPAFCREWGQHARGEGRWRLLTKRDPDDSGPLSPGRHTRSPPHYRSRASAGPDCWPDVLLVGWWSVIITNCFNTTILGDADTSWFAPHSFGPNCATDNQLSFCTCISCLLSSA